MNTPDTTLYTDTVHKILELHRSIYTYGRRVHTKELSGRKISSLRYLLEAGPRTIGELRDYLYISESTASEMMSQLEESGFVTRRRSEADNRVVLVDLTPSGRDLAQKAPLGGITLLRERLKELPPERLSLISAALSDLLEILATADDNCADRTG